MDDISASFYLSMHSEATLKAVSTFWIANPNSNLIENAAAGAQDVGIWCLFHWVPTGQSEARYPEGQAEHSPLGVFYNTAHSNFKAVLFIGKGVKATRANAEDPRENLTVDNARFCLHQDADPENPRVPLMSDGLIAPKNNDHVASARGGDIIFCISGFSDNGIGLILASDGTFPTDDGSGLEVTRSLLLEKEATLAPREAKTATGKRGNWRTHNTAQKQEHSLSVDSRSMMGLSGWQDAFSESSPQVLTQVPSDSS